MLNTPLHAQLSLKQQLGDKWDELVGNKK